MKKICNKGLSFLCFLVVLLPICFLICSCKDNKETYDTALKIEIEGFETEFIIGVNKAEEEITIPYDGDFHFVKLTGWQLPHHNNPNYSLRWMKAETYELNSFSTELFYIHPTGERTKMTDGMLFSAGEYILVCKANLPSTLWEAHTKYLKINYVEEEQ